MGKSKRSATEYAKGYLECSVRSSPGSCQGAFQGMGSLLSRRKKGEDTSEVRVDEARFF